jgi:hypothetical protein
MLEDDKDGKSRLGTLMLSACVNDTQSSLYPFVLLVVLHAMTVIHKDRALARRLHRHQAWCDDHAALD